MAVQGTAAFLDRNIGRCPRCMKIAFASVAVSWLVVALLLLIWQEQTALLVIAPAALTALWLAHVLTYATRVFGLLRAEYLPVPVRAGRSGGAVRSRRDIFWVIGAAALVTAGATLWLPAIASARGHACGEGRYCPDDAPNCCSRSQGKCCNGNWACSTTGRCFSSHSDARAACGGGTVWACS